MVAIAVNAVVLSSLFLVYWFNPGEMNQDRNCCWGLINSLGFSRRDMLDILSHIVQQNDLRIPRETGYFQLDGLSTYGHGNYRWNDGLATASTPY